MERVSLTKRVQSVFVSLFLNHSNLEAKGLSPFLNSFCLFQSELIVSYKILWVSYASSLLDKNLPY